MGLRSDPAFPARCCSTSPPTRRWSRRSGQRLETGGDRITDLHLWQIGPGHRAAVVSIVSDRPQPPAAYKQRLADVPRLSHVTVEVEPCTA